MSGFRYSDFCLMKGGKAPSPNNSEKTGKCLTFPKNQVLFNQSSGKEPLHFCTPYHSSEAQSFSDD
ncbi:MAG: hypothetical protein DRI57_33360 [Deltaproteobacteria bacterium]|nr:MAG: hypothetical protein DRI57_33360 [Deltaproteobacteria bacterium]